MAVNPYWAELSPSNPPKVGHLFNGPEKAMLRKVVLFLMASALGAPSAEAFTKQEYQTAVVGVGYTWCLYRSGLMSKTKAQQVGNRYMRGKGLDPVDIKAISESTGFRGKVRIWISSKGGCQRLAKVFLAAVKRRQNQQKRRTGEDPKIPSLREGLSDTPFVW